VGTSKDRLHQFNDINEQIKRLECWAKQEARTNNIRYWNKCEKVLIMRLLRVKYNWNKTEIKQFYFSFILAALTCETKRWNEK